MLPLRLFVGMFFKMLYRTCCSCECVKKISDWFLEGIFMNFILGLGIEVFMDFVIIVYLNFKGDNIHSILGEVLGWSVSISAVVIAFVALPLCLIWLVVKRPD